MSITSGIQLAPLVVDIKANSKQLINGVNEATNTSIAKAEALGNSLSNTGAKITKSITLPIAGAEVAIGKMALGFDTSFAKVSTLLDQGSVNYADYKDDILNASTDMKVAVDEYADAVYQSISAGVDQADAINFTNESVKLAKGGFTSAANAVDILTTVINAYSLSADDATSISDKLIATQNIGKTTVDELSTSLGRVIPTANAFGVKIDDVCTAMAQLTRNGIATAEATTYYNSMLNELGSSGTIADKTLRELSGKGFKQLMDEGKPLTEILGMLSTKAQESGLSLSDMFGSAEGAKAALTIMKNDGVEYNDILLQMKDSAGATEEAFKKIDSDPAEQLKGALNELKNSAIEMGEALIPTIKEVASKISDFAKWVNSLSDAEKNSIVKTGLFVAAFGPVLSVTGKAISTGSKLAKVISGIGTASKVAAGVGTAGATSGGIAGLTTGLGALGGAIVPVTLGIAAVGAGLYVASENADLLGKSCATTTEELSATEKVLNYLGGSTLKSKEEMQALGLEYQDFNENVSGDFQTKVHDMASEVKDFANEISKVNIDGICTQEEADGLKQRVSNAFDGVYTALQEKKNKIDELFGTGSNPDGSLNAEESYVYQLLVGDTEEALKGVENAKNELNNYIQSCAEQGVEVDKNKVMELFQKIKEAQLEAEAKNYEEIKAVHKNFAEQTKKMSIEDAANKLKEEKKGYSEELKAAKDTYEEKKKMLLDAMGTANLEERMKLQEMLDSETDAYEQSKTLAEDKWKNQLELIEEYNPKLLDCINITNGKMLTEQEKASVESLNKMKEHYDGLSNVTETGCYRLYNSEKGTWDNVAVTVDEATGRITGALSDNMEDYGAYSKSIEGDARKLMSTFDEKKKAIVSYLTEMGYSYSFVTGEILDNNGKTVGSLDELKKNEYGLYETTLTVNGQPVQVTVNKDGTISACNEINDALNNASRDRSCTIFVSTKGTIFDTSMNSNDKNWNWGNSNYSPIGNHYNGLDNVPFDGYTARLHKGERVLTAKENEQYNNFIRNVSSGDIIFNGNYKFNSKEDVDYLLNQAAIRLKRDRRGKGLP